MTGELVVLLNGREVGRVRRQKGGRLSFTYDEAWRNARGAYPLSMSMPMAAAEHGHAIIEAYLWGLLPDNEVILDRWARKFQVSARNAFALIAEVGEDCAGAVQFVKPERLEGCLNPGNETVEWLDEHEVAERLSLLRSDSSAWRMPRDTGQFSLAGAQPKTALLFEDGRWGVPSGRTPTTHILKPPTGTFDGQAENEHFCLALARRLGIPSASSSVAHFEGETAIVIERYDRRRTEGGFVRIHQEDTCQALGVPTTRKYENEGGPGAIAIVELLRTYSGEREEDIASFLDALALNWLIAGTDAHAKNYSLLIGEGGRVRLAPLYDVASILPYEEFDYQRLKLAMRIGRQYRLRDIGGREWRRLAGDLHLEPETFLRQVVDLADRLADEAASVRERMLSEGLEHRIIARLAKRVSDHAVKCGKILKAELGT